MSQDILQQLNLNLFGADLPEVPAPETEADQPAAADERPVRIDRVRRALCSIRDVSEWAGVPAHLKLYWISAYTNSLLERMSDHADSANDWLTQCNTVADQMRLHLDEPVEVTA
jgi:hypothetical protein